MKPAVHALIAPPPLSTREFHPSTVLVGMETARAMLGMDGEEVLEQIEQGRFRWVWDISSRPAVGGPAPGPPRLKRHRAPRFWLQELQAPDLCRELTLEQVLEALLGQGRASWPATRVAQLLLCSRPAILRLVRAGELTGPVRDGARLIARADLEAFLRRRLWR